MPTSRFPATVVFAALSLILSFFFTSYCTEVFASELTVEDFAKPKCEIDRPIRFAGLDWDSNRFHVAVAGMILKYGYGCDFETIPGSSLPMIAALGRGDIDINMEIWENSIGDAWLKLEQAGKVKTIGVNFPDAVQGFFVPTYLVKGDPLRGITPKAPQLKNVKNLPHYKELFADPEQPDKGRFYNCILGWTCESTNTKKLQIYGLSEHYTNFRPGTGAALAAAIAAAYEKGEPIVFYYWGPTWVLGKYDLTMLEEPPYDEKVWKRFILSKNPTQATAYPMVAVKTATNTKFAKNAPQIIEFIKRYRTTSKIISEALAYVRNNEDAKIEDAAIHFLQTKQDIWQAWVSEEKVDLILAGLKNKKVKQKRFRLRLDRPINEFVGWLVKNYESKFDAMAKPLLWLIITIESVFLFVPWWLFIIALTICGFMISRHWKLPLIIASCFLMIWALNLWSLAIQTLALMFISTIVCIIIGIPIGIAITRNDRVRGIVLPVLDGMQTMPSFVYLIPALMLFGLGKVPAVFATVIYAIAPLIRLTNHGISMVDPYVIEAARSFGANYWQILFGVQLPLALRTIMTGINQTTMLCLSMVVIASMIGARGLGEQVLLGIQKLDVGQGFTAGIAIVLMAIVLDRITQTLGWRLDKTR